MNEITKTLLNYNYGNKRLNKYRFIMRRSKNKRILNKVFCILLFAYMKKKKVAVIGKLVIITKNNYIFELERFANEQK